MQQGSIASSAKWHNATKTGGDWYTEKGKKKSVDRKSVKRYTKKNSNSDQTKI
jgi:hypothetical protein